MHQHIPLCVCPVQEQERLMLDLKKAGTEVQNVSSARDKLKEQLASLNNLP